MRVTRLAVAALILVSGAVAAQPKPNFSGRWAVVSPKTDAGQEQVVIADDKSLTTQRPDGSRKMVYQLDGVERRLALPPSASRTVTIMAAAKWDGSRIVITTNSSYENGMRTQGKEVWSIDAQSRLVIDYTETGPGASPLPTRTIFTRKP